MKYFAMFVLIGLAAGQTQAATIEVSVRDKRGAAVRDAVVYVEGEARDPLRKKTAVMDQRNRTFVPRVLVVQTGTAVSFPNSDNIRHQVYSFSPARTFKLPLYKGTPSEPVVFTTPGVVSLGCNIHDAMSAYIVVVDTPHFESTGAKGEVVLTLPGAAYSVKVWHPSMRDASQIAVRKIRLGDGGRERLSFVLDVPARGVPAEAPRGVEEKFKKYGNVRS